MNKKFRTFWYLSLYEDVGHKLLLFYYQTTPSVIIHHHISLPSPYRIFPLILNPPLIYSSILSQFTTSLQQTCCRRSAHFECLQINYLNIRSNWISKFVPFLLKHPCQILLIATIFHAYYYFSYQKNINMIYPSSFSSLALIYIAYMFVCIKFEIVKFS